LHGCLKNKEDTNLDVANKLIPENYDGTMAHSNRGCNCRFTGYKSKNQKQIWLFSILIPLGVALVGTLVIAWSDFFLAGTALINGLIPIIATCISLYYLLKIKLKNGVIQGSDYLRVVIILLILTAPSIINYYLTSSNRAFFGY
jgi:hypothetical protein